MLIFDAQVRCSFLMVIFDAHFRCLFSMLVQAIFIRKIHEYTNILYLYMNAFHLRSFNQHYNNRKRSYFHPLKMRAWLKAYMFSVFSILLYPLKMFNISRKLCEMRNEVKANFIKQFSNNRYYYLE